MIKGVKSKKKGIVPTKMDLVLEQTQQGSSHEVSVSTDGFEELKRNVRIKGEKKEALRTLRQKLSQYICSDPLDGLHVDDKLHFVEKPVEIMDPVVKRLKRSHIPLFKVRWNSKWGPEFTWEREDQFKQKYPHLFTNRASSSTT
nr:putative reverse transcriptase domain-containing protein [Tanacetum cinerariifolium]